MAESSLTTTSASGTQNQAENPQTAGNSAGSGAPASSVQPGTTTKLLDNNTGGVPLTSQNLSTVALPQATASVAQPATPPKTTSSPLTTGLSVLFFLLAAVVLYAVLSPAKNTTK